MKPLNKVSFGLMLILSINNYCKSSNVLHLNSYGITYSWGDSVAIGVKQTISQYKDIHLYVEYLDAKRFGKNLFQEHYQFLKKKYANLKIDVVISTDNDALDFLFQYGDDLFPSIPIVFGGVNNPNEYKINGSRYWGILEGVDQDSVNALIMRIIPNIKKLIFITDSTTTSLVNLKYIRTLEPKYKNRVKFEYINNVGLDSIINYVQTIEAGNAIALLDLFQDKDKKPLNSDLVAQKLESISTVPIFIDSESTFGKGLAGGIINKGSLHGSDIANLAIEFLNNPKYVPIKRVIHSKDRYHFDYEVLQRYNVDYTLLPINSTIINKPNDVILKYLLYLSILTVIITLLVLTIFILLLNIKKRKAAEELVKTKLQEIEEKNVALHSAKNRAEESDKLKTAFLGNISHEIRTPLNAIIGFSSLFQQEDDSELQREYFQLITLNSEHLLAIIEDIVEISKIESGQITLHYSSFSINESINELIQEMSALITTDSVKITIGNYLSNNELNIISDKMRINQILRNLISNAIKFTEAGIIEIEVLRISANKLQFSVKDSGIGIQEEYSNSIYGNFWKKESPSNKLYGGTGVGLSICKGILTMMGGEIWFESNKEKGCTFFFTIPIQ